MSRRYSCRSCHSANIRLINPSCVYFLPFTLDIISAVSNEMARVVIGPFWILRLPIVADHY
ncbi:MAG: hypothetical protein WCB31_08240 [Nitrososphaeraceae archaeon]